MEQPTLTMPPPGPDGHYDSPPVAAVRRCWESVCQGQADESDLLLTLQAFADRVQFELNRLEGQVFQGQSDPKDPIFAAVVEAFERQLEAVERMAEELNDPGQGHMVAGLELALQANDALMKAQFELVQRVHHQSYVDCPFCSTTNERGSERCSSCSRNLPMAEPTGQTVSVVQAEGLPLSAGEGRPMTENALRITQAVDAYRQGQLDFEQLYAVLDEVEEKLLGHQDGNQQAIEAEGDPQGYLAETHTALERSLEALDHMRLAWDKDDDSYLEEGLHRLHLASDELLRLYSALTSGA